MGVAIDMDDVLVLFQPSLVRFLNQKYKTGLRVEDIVDYQLGRIWGVTEEELVESIFEFYRTDLFQDMPPMPGSEKVIPLISQEHSLYVITSRPEWMKQQTYDWIGTHFPGMFSDVILTSQCTLQEKGEKKSDVCQRLGATVMIEDCLDYALDCHLKGIRTIILDMPWNQGALPKDMPRVYSWHQISGELAKNI